jgi:voltage-gated potassium channel Kch
MRAIKNIWEDDMGFIWMLVISIMLLVSTQLLVDMTWESRFTVRTGFFLFTLTAINFSSLSKAKKLIGYGIAFAILLLAIALIRKETQSLNLLYTVLVNSYMIYIIALVVNQIFANRVVTAYKIGGAIAIYIFLGHIWASLYLTIYIIHPGAFQYGGEIIPADVALKQLSYFSFVTLTTVGYGDLTAVNPVARVFVMLEALLGQLFPAIFIAKLVSRQIEEVRKN